MDLLPELFEQIVAATAATVAGPAADPARPAADRSADRRSPRARTSAALAVCTWDDPMAVLSLRVRDLSAGGVGLLYRDRMALDEQLVVRLPTGGGDSVPVLGRVVYWEPLAADLFALGVHFDRLVDEAELAARAAEADLTPAEASGVLGRLVAWTWRKAS